MDGHSAQGACEEEGEQSADSVGLLILSDEILLCILYHLPVCDLLLNVANVCHKLRTLCYDKTLLSQVCFSDHYLANDMMVVRTIEKLSSHVQSLSLNGCYWLSGSTLKHLSRCREVTQLDVTGCRLTTVRLSHLLSSLSHLRCLAFDVTSTFSSSQLSSEAVDTLSRLSELRQSLLTPSYGVVPYCAKLRKLMLQFDISDVTREGVGVSCQLMVGQSSVPHYQQLEEFTARLAPGEVNQTLLLLYLAVFSVHIPGHLRVFLVSIPGPNPAHWPSARTLAQSLGQRGDLEALQLPRTWLDPPSLKLALGGNSPRHLSFSRCPALWPQVFQSLLEGGISDPTQLCSLNLSGINHVLYSDCRNIDDQLLASTLSRLAIGCSNLKHLNLMHTHYHHEKMPSLNNETHLCSSLANLRKLCSLTLPACALSDGVNSNNSSNTTSPSSCLLGLKKCARVGLQNYKPDTGQSSSVDSTSGLAQLTTGCVTLETLEVIGPGFVSVLPRLEPCTRSSVEPRGMCAWARGVGDAHIAALEGLKRLRCLTLAGLPGILKGTGLVHMAKHCKNLKVLSLANIGAVKTMNYAPALQETLRNCTQLEELRLEQPYLSANSAFFEALSCCPLLRRLCLISRSGTFDPTATETFMERCRLVVMCHLFMGGTLVACRTLQKTLIERFSAERPALSVVIYPLHHEDLPSVIRDIPLTLLDTVTLFQSHVAQPPHLSPY
ncbi:F-box/LRR-repeat protein 18 isoform X2 [Boleophthalmus pectinirostris]|uniref:F-box/LRR-repeat protein 18 isoform X2 n=1 Tax=Boleophthalmus pectinirostris TaxID=150288 RepID=UPI000A1C1C0B|nr:F-box/LRR-repeat protein 18 isoform X2 [Boleophthalmus pectinirostris]